MEPHLSVVYIPEQQQFEVAEAEKFNGDILKVKEFWDHFDVEIGTNRHLRPVEKLNYLRAYLTSEANRVIAGLTATDEDYDVAVALLRDRYGSAQASIDAHYSRLMDLQAVSHNVAKIRDLLDKVESNLRCFKTLMEAWKAERQTSGQSERQAERERETERDYKANASPTAKASARPTARASATARPSARASASARPIARPLFLLLMHACIKPLSCFGKTKFTVHVSLPNLSRTPKGIYTTDQTTDAQDKLQTRYENIWPKIFLGENIFSKPSKSDSLPSKVILSLKFVNWRIFLEDHNCLLVPAGRTQLRRAECFHAF